MTDEARNTRVSEPIRSRWTPKPEQILILESIFNSGMVNPPKDETVRIRKLLEKFGSVGDANVFYWFQNRRSRSRRRQRQIQATLVNDEHTSVIQYDGGSSSSGNCYDQSYQMIVGSCYGNNEVQVMDQSSGYVSMDNSSLHYQTGMITVFINGVATEVGRGPLDTMAMFGSDFVLFHSSGMPVQVNEYGVSVHSLQHGESYFQVPRNSEIGMQSHFGASSFD